MNSHATVVFADLSGSTALYETWGNVRATAEVTRLTQWICEVVQAHGGRVVKKLGDGVLGVFSQAAQAVAGAAQLQRSLPHAGSNGMQMRVGVASGEVLEVDGDTYGDAVNVASRLCERAGVREIWTTDVTAVDAGAVPRIQFRKLGVFEMRGKAEPLVVYLADWHEDEPSDSLTVQAALTTAIAPLDSGLGSLKLSWFGEVRQFSSTETPLHVGRSQDAQLCINDPRVSRLHIRIDWRSSGFMLTDLSSFGTWVRFDGSNTEVPLRRDACLLHGAGQIALGMPFGANTPTLDFHVAGSSMSLR